MHHGEPYFSMKSMTIIYLSLTQVIHSTMMKYFWKLSKKNYWEWAAAWIIFKNTFKDEVTPYFLITILTLAFCDHNDFIILHFKLEFHFSFHIIVSTNVFIKIPHPSPWLWALFQDKRKSDICINNSKAFFWAATFIRFL